MSNQKYTLKVKEIIKETPDCITVAFEVPSEYKSIFEYQQGQYITIVKTLNGEELRRSYSICAAPFENNLKVAIKKVEDGRFSTWANENLNEGDLLDIMPPLGKFNTSLDQNHQKKYVFFAAGSGITPIISNIKAVLKSEPLSQVFLFYGNRNKESIIFKNELEDLKNQYFNNLAIYHIFSQEAMDSDMFKGHINIEKCKEMHLKVLDFKIIDEVLICGPESMMLDIKSWFSSIGFDSKHIHFELFGTDLVKKESQASNEVLTSDQASKITIIMDSDEYNFELKNSSQSILEAGIKQGANLPFSCKGGVCCTCRAKVLAGSVSMDTNYSLEPDEIEAGFILTCQSHPTSSKVVISFDEH